MAKVGGLGRYPFLDVRDGKHLMRKILKAETVTVPENKVWKHGVLLDQGQEGACVGFGWTAWENCAPMGQRVQQGNEYAFGWYHRAKQVDPWEGEDYEGTTVRAGASVALERGAISEYLWAGSKDEVDAWLLTKGPIVVGSDWFGSMDTVGANGWVRVDRSSGVRGGHCYMLFGRRNGHYHFQNSWGSEYADDGVFYMNTEQFTNLINYGNAEFCTALQTAPVME